MSEGVIVIDCYGYAAGLFWFSDLDPFNLHAEIHLLINPRYLKQVIKQGVFVQALRWGFESLGIQKINAEALEFQGMAIRLLEKHHFRFVGRQNLHTLKNGKPVDAVLYELKKSKFRKFYGDQYGHPKQETQGRTSQLNQDG